MKTYKIKSLCYFGCFVLAALLYYTSEQQNEFEQFKTKEIADMVSDDFENIDETNLEVLP